MKEIKIKYATIIQLKEVQNLNLNLFEFEEENFNPKYNLNWTSESTNYFKKSIEDNSACTLVAISGEKIVGYLIGWTLSSANWRLVGKRAEIENMFISKKFRNKGIGSKLVDEFLVWAKKNDIKNISVSALSKNKNAINFYKQVGFKNFESKLEINL